jgi:hypothetical protein
MANAASQPPDHLCLHMNFVIISLALNPTTITPSEQQATTEQLPCTHEVKVTQPSPVPCEISNANMPNSSGDRLSTSFSM